MLVREPADGASRFDAGSAEVSHDGGEVELRAPEDLNRRSCLGCSAQRDEPRLLDGLTWPAIEA
jgi:hypothetical protein